ncbi:uncharacterized protein ACNS7B_004632 isoform 1-T1 [Menidia menidia]
MAQVTENGALNGVLEPVEAITAAVEAENSEGVEVPQPVACEGADIRPNLDDDGKEGDGQTACLPTDGNNSSTESKWAVGDRCRAVWSEDGQVYPATLVALDGQRCRVRFSSYGNEEDMDLSTLQSPEAAPQNRTSQLQEWKPGSRCRAVYSVDGLVYPAIVLWVKGQRCRVRYDDYNNEEEHDISDLLNPNELHGPIRTMSKQPSSWRPGPAGTNEWKWKRREESMGERGKERRSGWKDDQQNPPTVREKPESQSKEKEAEKSRGNQQRDGAEKPTDYSFPLFPPFSTQISTSEPVSFLPPPPPPVWASCGKEATGPPDVGNMTSMLMQWYMCGFHTGSYMTQQLFKSTRKDEVKNPR